MLGIELDRGVGKRAAALEFVRQHVFDVIDPGIEPLLRIVGVVGDDALPNLIALARELGDVGNDQIVFRLEVPVKRHLVREGRFGDRLDADRMQAVAVEKLPRNEQNTLARWPRRKLGRPALRNVVQLLLCSWPP